MRCDQLQQRIMEIESMVGIGERKGSCSMKPKAIVDLETQVADLRCDPISALLKDS